MKTVGIIGGLGPETSAEFCLRVVSLCLKRNKIQRPEILSINVPVSFELENKFINKSQGKKEFCSLLVSTAKKLEKAGADFLVMPCNTAHIFIDEIRTSVNIPVLSIIDETTSFLKRRGVGKIGLLATPATIGNKLFDKKIDVINPDKDNQKRIGTIINKILQNKHTVSDKLKIFKIIDNFPKKPDAILLACTDLQLLITESKHNELNIFDTMEILAQATVREMLAPKKP